uniref:Uncharacterized protein n=1 Tax=Pristionchus pacificus TaxID=54126 RepID=A0A2A6CG60_PRIPA|eukprot:PDM77086.1 hypothetical protein PRIPAC_42481 [Pristionchus pacificus]
MGEAVGRSPSPSLRCRDRKPLLPPRDRKRNANQQAQQPAVDPESRAIAERYRASTFRSLPWRSHRLQAQHRSHDREKLISVREGNAKTAPRGLKFCNDCKQQELQRAQQLELLQQLQTNEKKEEHGREQAAGSVDTESLTESNEIPIEVLRIARNYSNKPLTDMGQDDVVSKTDMAEKKRPETSVEWQLGNGHVQPIIFVSRRIDNRDIGEIEWVPIEGYRPNAHISRDIMIGTVIVQNSSPHFACSLITLTVAVSVTFVPNLEALSVCGSEL